MMILPLALAFVTNSEPAEQPVFYESLAEALSQDEEEEEPEGWHGTFNTAASKTYGNTDVERFSIGIDAKNRVDDDRYTVGFLWNYGSENGSISERKAFMSGKWDHFISEDSYAYGLVTGAYDDQANIDLRYTVGGGYGRQFRDDDEWKINGEIGLSYVFEEYDTEDVAHEEDIDEDGVDEDDDYVALRLAYGAEWNYSERWQFSQTAEVFPSVEDPEEDIYARVDTRAKATLTENMFAQLQWVFDWDNTPAEGNDRDDHLLLLGVGWAF
ncbi:MAG: DUF481 domain-containing protein [bacterium]|nr:DUF481 domain-containing protein [bacterium]